MNAYELAWAIYRTFGKEAARRFLTPPRSSVERLCKRTGADVTKALEERDEAVTETLEFLESMIDKDFEDPDEEEG